MDVKKYFDSIFKDGMTLGELVNVSIENLKFISYKIPNEMPKYVEERRFDFDFLETQKEFALKEIYHNVGMYGFVSWKWVEPFAEWIKGKKVLEVMAGRGWLSHALRLKGIDIISTDNFSWHKNAGWEEPLTEITNIDAVKSIDKFGKQVDIVIMSWPYMDNTAFQVLKRLHEVNPSALVVYIGEYYGCTADKEFHNHFEEIEDIGFNKVIEKYQRWNNIHDRPFLGRYRG